jgi:hypothetical protein
MPQNNEERNKNIKQITTTIPIEVWQEAKNRRFSWQELIISGLEARKGNPILMERLQEYQEDSKKAQAKLRELALKFYELEQEKSKSEGKI